MDKESTCFTTGSLVKLPSGGTVPEPTLHNPKTFEFLPNARNITLQGTSSQLMPGWPWESGDLSQQLGLEEPW